MSEEDLDIVKISKEERVFLHDMSNKLLIAQGMGTFVFKSLATSDCVDPKVVERMTKSINAMNEMVEIIKARRTILHSRSK